MVKIKMLNGNVLVKMQTAEEKTSGGIILAPNTQKSYAVAEVVSVPEGQDCVTEKDIIYVPRFAGSEIELEGVVYTIVNIQEIILIV